MFEFIVVVVSQ